ncbi:MAG: hypothetical protein CVV07_09345 [Gammaproteobacteria bacterium HGW-Gammaproteobacteria-11]|nr:MAG: hypothetical protein CVV07_09345 [Gammaproteobacteria bacterium HGW-Gammaproteobacteria-11]
MTAERTKPIGIDDLPAEIELDLPAKSIGFGWIVRAVGLVVTAVGVLTLLLGPETIYYNRDVGMTFVQMIQAFPGPIATVGFLLAGLGQAMESNASTSQALAIEDALLYKVVIPERRIPAGFRLQTDALGGNRFRISLVEKTEAEIAEEERSTS